MSKAHRSGARVAALALIAALATIPAFADPLPRAILAEGSPVALPLGTLSWSGLEVRTGAPAPHAPATPRLPVDGEWRVALEAPSADDVSHHGITLELAPGLRARQGASYEAVRIDGLNQPAELAATVMDADGHESPAMALAMGSRVQVEVFDVRAGTTLKLEVTAHAPVELPRDEPVAPASASVACLGGGGPCDFVQVAAGVDHSLGLTRSGEVRAWGRYDQLGDGTTLDHVTPVAVLDTDGVGPLTGITQVSAGGSNLALTTGGEVLTWWRGTPTLVPGPGGVGTLSDIVQVSAGNFQLALTRAGDVYGCGIRTEWIVGGVAQVAAGPDHCLALTTDGRVLAWGANDRGQLGNNSIGYSAGPVAVLDANTGLALTDIAQVAAGDKISLALTTGGEVRQWGHRRGGIGMDTMAVPVADALGGPLSGIASIAAGGDFWGAGVFRLAVTLSGEVRAWGSSSCGQLGVGSTLDFDAAKVVLDESGVAPLTGVTQVSAGWRHSLALVAGGEVRAWGDNSHGALGNGTPSPTGVPTCMRAEPQGAVLPDFVQVVAGAHHALGLTVGGEVRAWGDDTYGQLGNGTSTNWLGDGTNITRTTPVVVLDVAGTGPLGSIAQVAAGGDHSVALTTGGEVRAWGRNDHGQLGDGTTTSRIRPVVVLDPGGSALSGVTQVAAGSYHSLALTSGTEVLAWGANTYGALGDGTQADRSTPRATLGVGGTGTLLGISQVTAGEGHSLALTTGGEVYAWGSNFWGELGDCTRGSRTTPVAVLGVLCRGLLSEVAQVAAGGNHSLALTTGGEVRAWGDNTWGQLGDGGTGSQLTPVVTLDAGGTGPLTGITRIAAGYNHSLALTIGGEVRAWGRGDLGQLGNASQSDGAPAPVVDITGSGALGGARDIAAGGSVSLAITGTGEVHGWGDDALGQLADGQADCTPLPVETACVAQPSTPTACSAGPAIVACGGPVTPAAFVGDPDADPLTLEWSSSCPDALFSPSADVLRPTVSFASNCGVSCDLTLTVSGGGDTCSSTVHVTLDDVTPPRITCPANVVLLCTDPVPAPDPTAVSATDNCPAGATVVWVADVETGTCPTRTARTYRATDGCGNTAECVQYFTQFDHVPESDCSNFRDDDGDTLMDCRDDDCVMMPEPDCDRDGVPNGRDCAPTDANVEAAPGEVPRLDVVRTLAEIALKWTNLGLTCGYGTGHDVASGVVSELRADRGFARAACLVQDVLGAAASDPRPLPPRAPGAPADGYWYLVRGKNTCAIGTWGEGTLGPRAIDPLLCQ